MSELSKLKYYDVVEKAVEDAGKPLSEFTKENFIDLLFNKVGMSVSSFSNLKRTIIDVSKGDDNVKRVLAGVKYINVTHTDTYGSSYFKSYHDMMKYAKQAVQKTASERDSDVHIYDVTLASLTLAWYGILIDDCVNVKKNDVLETSELVLPSGDKIKICKEAYVFLTEYINSEGYFAFHGMERWKPYQPSTYLLRTDKSMQCTTQTIRSGISRYLSSPEKKVTYDSVYWSGVFSRIREYEEKNGRIYLPNQLNTEDRTAFMELMMTFVKDKVNSEYDVYSRYKLYKAYRKFFYNE